MRVSRQYKPSSLEQKSKQNATANKKKLGCALFCELLSLIRVALRRKFGFRNIRWVSYDKLNKDI